MDETFARQPVVGDGDRRTRHVETAREHAAGWKQVAGTQPSVQNGHTKLPVDLSREILAAGETHVI
jgi:hypothetical protein